MPCANKIAKPARLTAPPKTIIVAPARRIAMRAWQNHIKIPMIDKHAANRREDLRLITGRGRYASDMNLPGQLYAGFLRTDRAHARIVSIDTRAALRRPGVVAVFTGADAIAAGYTQFPNLMSFTGPGGATIVKPPRPVIADGVVRFVGEPVALIVADTALAAQDAFDAVEIEYAELPVVVDAEKALELGAPQLHAAAPRNLAFEWSIGDGAAVDAAFARAAHISRVKVMSQRVVPSPMEPRACLVSYSNADDCYDIWVCSQGITMMRWQFAALTGLPEEKLRFHMHDNGGGFGQRAAVYPEYAAQMIASRKLGRPVKWISSRSESFLSDSHGRGIIIAGELALDADAHFLAARYRFNCDMGAYLTPTAANSHVRNPSICTTGVYRIPALQANFKVVFTNTVPVAAYRGAGRPDTAYAIERLVDQAAFDLNIERDEIRRRNFIPPDAFPYKTPTLGVYEKSDFAGCLAQVMRDADWHGFSARRETARAAGLLRGIGLSSVIEGTAPGAAPKDQVLVEFDKNGAMTLFVACLSSGQGHETTFTRIFSDALGIANENVSLRESVHDRKLIGNFSGGSRSLVGAGSVCQLAAKKLIEHARPFAAEALELEPSQVDYANGAWRSRDGAQSITLKDLAAKLADQQPHPLNTMTEATVGATYPNGCHVAEVEIDPETGVTRIVNYTTADDCGNVMNHTIVEGQVHGGVVQGAGQVFGEHAVYDEASGQLLAGSFSDYYMPRAGLLPKISVGDYTVPSATNALGAKGAGESGCTAAIPALVSATLDALRPLGITHLDMPLTPDKVWRAIRAAANTP